jgi:ATP-dependent DNA helicase PIF1
LQEEDARFHLAERKLVMFGDPYQLSPVPGNNEERAYMAENYQSPWFFDAHVWREDSLGEI